MAWPDDRDLPVEVEGAFGADLTADPGTWSWTDLSARLRSVPITMRAGKSGGAGRVSPGTCSVTLDNDDGALTPLHPLSPYWPNVELGTPVRVRLRRGEDAFARTTTNGWGSADSGQAWTASGADFSTSAGVARHIHSTVNVLRRSTLAVALADTEQMVDVAPSVLLTGAALVTGLLFRYQNASNYYWLRCEFNSGGTSVMLKITRCVGGIFTDLATINPLPGVPYAAGSYLRVRASVIGTRLAMKAWSAAGAEPAGWTLTATDSSITAAGATGLQSWLVAGNTNTLPVEARYRSYTARVDRFSGFADQWEPTYLPTTIPGQADSAVRVTASGILRRLGQGTKPAASAMRRTLTASGALAYWPVEDGPSAGRVASARAGHQALSIAGSVRFADIESWSGPGKYTVTFGTAALADMSGGGMLQAAVPGEVTAATATASGWTVAVASDIAVGADTSADFVLAEINTPSGTYVRWQLVVIKATFDVQLIAYNAAGTATVILTDTLPYAALVPHNVAVWQSGGTIQAGYMWDSVDGYKASGSVAGTVGGVTSIVVNTTRTTATVDWPVGHIAVWAGHNLDVVDLRDGAMISALYSWAWSGLPSAVDAAGEPATVRLARLTAEDGVALDMPAVDLPGEAMMGPQPVGGQLELYQECEDADLGVLHERGFALGYLPRSARYNRPVDFTIDLATYRVTDGGSDVLRPVYDDQGIRNEVTAERRDGSSVVAVDPASQARHGVYSDAVELNLVSDVPLDDQAWWRLHLGAVVELREQTFALDLAANPELVDGWLSCGVGSRVVRTNPPAQYGPGPLDRLVAGWSETIGPRSWQVQVAPAPATPWDVAVAGGAPRIPARGSTVAGPLTDSAMAFALASTDANGPWTTNPAHFPQDLRVGGERVTAAGIGPALSDTFTRTVSGGWGTSDTGQAWTVDGTASQYSVVTSLGVHAVNALNTVFRSRTTALSLATVDLRLGVRLDLAPTGSYIRTEPAVRIVDTNNYYGLRIHVQPSGVIDLQLIRVAGGAETLLAAAGSGVTHTAGMVLNIRVQAEGSTLRGRVWRADAAEPGGWQVTATDSTHAAGDVGVTTLFPPGNTNTLPYNVIYDDVSLPNIQTVTLSARGVNGVQRAWPAGTEVDVWTPAIAPL